jgi:hypothetical protein
VNPLPVVHLVEESPEMPPGIGEVLVLRQIDLLLFRAYPSRSQHRYVIKAHAKCNIAR